MEIKSVPSGTQFVRDDAKSRFRYFLKMEKLAVLLVIQGEFDAQDYDRVYADLSEAFQNLERKDLIVNMSELRYIDSRSLGLFVHIMHLISERDGAICISDCSPPIRRVLAITRLDRIFHIVDTIS